jgi:queuosine precursor transporter
MVYIYIGSLTLANLLVAWLGPWFSPINAFVLIGLDLVLRDKLHDRWQGDRLALRMFGIIAAAGVISWVINKDAGMIAVASVVSFMVAMTVDAFIYQKLKNLPWWQRANGSNIGGAATDSVVFPTMAFGSLMPEIVALQFAAKVTGGFFWSLIIDSLSRHTNHAKG